MNILLIFNILIRIQAHNSIDSILIYSYLKPCIKTHALHSLCSTEGCRLQVFIPQLNSALPDAARYGGTGPTPPFPTRQAADGRGTERGPPYKPALPSHPLPLGPPWLPLNSHRGR